MAGEANNEDTIIPQLSNAAAEELEASWEQELRGEQGDVGANADSSPEYVIHALHELLTEFPQAPLPLVRKTLREQRTFVSARVSLLRNPGASTLKRKRKLNGAPPGEIPGRLAKEITLGEEVDTVSQLLKKRRVDREKTLAELKGIGGLSICSCCFDDEVHPEEELVCDASGHIFCITCVKRTALAFFGSGLFALDLIKAVGCASGAGSNSTSSDENVACTVGVDVSLCVLRCMHTCGCTGRFSENDLKRALPPKDYLRYSRRSSALQAVASGIPGLTPCPACDFMVELANDEHVVSCLDPSCQLTSCRYCGKEDHRPLKCGQVENAGATKIRTFLEERMTDSLGHRCPNPKCHKLFDRIEGCNKMKCVCGTNSCFLCGAVLEKLNPYNHYADGSVGGGRNNKTSRCIVYGTPDWATKSLTKGAKNIRDAYRAYLQANPELQDLAEEKDFLAELGVPQAEQNSWRDLMNSACTVQ